MKKFYELLLDVPLRQSFTYLADEKGEAEAGKRASVPFGNRELVGYIINSSDDPPAGIDVKKIKPIRRVVDKEIIFGSAEISFARWVSDYYFCTHGEALAAMIPSGRRVTPQASFSANDFDESLIAPNKPVLSGEQRQALSAITESANAAHGKKWFYLFGITGSGKTEVFLQAAEKFLNEGKSVIYLVPEISLTHQTAEAVEKRFGSIAATLHSGMTGSERLTVWLKIKRGETRIAVGPRSAVFAPLKNLGLIIIDEEHDGSYKSGNTPRYHARQAAMKRCADSNAALVMGSATPSVEAWKLMNEGKIIRLELTRRLSGGTPPEITPVDLSKTDGCLTWELKQEIRKTAAMGRQTILFLNRRGFAYFYRCRNCGFELKCKHCSVSLTWHKSKGKAVCHYCGWSANPPTVCPSCGSMDAGFTGFGTEMIEEEMRRTFPELRIRRIDADSAAKKGSLEETFAMFRAGLIDVLLGTQMVAKGLNFPGVRLVGIVFADIGLQMPDFRAAERTFSLIVQVAGRAGRFFPDGKVLLQTLRPDDPVIKRACALDVAGFYEDELNQRQLMDFPPWSRLIRLTLRGKEEERVKKGIQRLHELVLRFLPPNAGILGPAECPMEMIAGNHRQHIILRGKEMGGIHAACGAALKLWETGKDPKVYIEVDVDPVNVL